VNAPTPPPAWYPDPSRAPGLRYWDGQQWTGYTHDTASAQPAPNKRTRWIAVGIAVVAAVFAYSQVKVARQTREEQAQPNVVIFAESTPSHWQFLDVVLKNFGTTPTAQSQDTLTVALYYSFF